MTRRRRHGQRGTSRIRGGRALSVVLATTIAAAGLTLGLATAGAGPAAAAANGCGYADTSANNGTHASTICWFDFSAFDATEARSTEGQPIEIALDGGLVADFTVKVTNLPNSVPMNFEARSTPLETRFAFGTDAYRGIPGLNALYSLASPSGNKAAKITFDDIRVTDAQGDPVAGYSFVAADAEDNVRGESFAWSSDKPLNEIERLAPNGGWGCKNPVGLGTTSVTCAGTGVGGTTIAGGKSTALLVAADTPTTFATTWVTSARSAIAIGVQTAKLTVVKQVASRIDPADSFTVSAEDSTGAVVGQATTGTAGSASTPGLVVAPGSTYTLGESAADGSATNLADYVTPSWSCTNTAAGSTTVLPSGTGSTTTVTPAAGDDITCTVTNTAKATGISLQKLAAPPVDASGDGITDAGDTIVYSFVVTNTGQTDIDTVAIDDPKVGTVSCPPGTIAPAGVTTCTADAPYVITTADVTAAHPLGSPAVLTSNASSTSTPTVTPEPSMTLVKSASPSAQADFTEGQIVTYSFVVTNTGNVPLADVAVQDTAFTGTGTLPSPACPAGAAFLAPGAQVVCTASYTLTQLDIDAGSVTNTASVTADPPGLTPPPPPTTSTVTIPQLAAPAVSLVKSTPVTAITAAGQVVDYSFSVTNTGNTTLTDPEVIEGSFSGVGTVSTPDCPAGASPLLPGQVVVCTASYTVRAGDLTGRPLVNTATVTATAPGGGSVDSDPSTARVDDVADVPPGTGPAGLAITGMTVGGTVAAAAVLLIAGLALFFVRRRRRAVE
ncbi:DUF7507 domain-containing protein [Pseudolysinimonas kribbensis]|uniref:DUF7507 domain-containing protein n=1 Tax=Pseudolysinimonas kribbensis TaxID=433641 RepID=UPI0031CEF78D